MKMTSFELLKKLDKMSAVISYISFINEIPFTVSKEKETVLYFLGKSDLGGAGGREEALVPAPSIFLLIPLPHDAHLRRC